MIATAGIVTQAGRRGHSSYLSRSAHRRDRLADAGERRVDRLADWRRRRRAVGGAHLEALNTGRRRRRRRARAGAAAAGAVAAKQRADRLVLVVVVVMRVFSMLVGQ